MIRTRYSVKPFFRGGSGRSNEQVMHHAPAGVFGKPDQHGILETERYWIWSSMIRLMPFKKQSILFRFRHFGITSAAHSPFSRLALSHPSRSVVA